MGELPQALTRGDNLFKIAGHLALPLLDADTGTPGCEHDRELILCLPGPFFSGWCVLQSLAPAESSGGNALSQNPRFAPTLRVLAASRARLGELDGAAAAVRELLQLEPHLTLDKLRQRLRHMSGSGLQSFLEALQMAGVPD